MRFTALHVTNGSSRSGFPAKKPVVLFRHLAGLHQREVFLFNDILVITKILKRKKNTVTYEFRQSHMLAGLSVTVFENQFYPYGIKISPSQKWESVIKQQQRTNAGRQLPLLILNARYKSTTATFHSFKIEF